MNNAIDEMQIREQSAQIRDNIGEQIERIRYNFDRQPYHPLSADYEREAGLFPVEVDSVARAEVSLLSMLRLVLF
jgi:hypothetical protein